MRGREGDQVHCVRGTEGFHGVTHVFGDRIAGQAEFGGNLFLR